MSGERYSQMLQKVTRNKRETDTYNSSDTPKLATINTGKPGVLLAWEEEYLSRGLEKRGEEYRTFAPELLK